MRTFIPNLPLAMRLAYKQVRYSEKSSLLLLCANAKIGTLSRAISSTTVSSVPVRLSYSVNVPPEQPLTITPWGPNLIFVPSSISLSNTSSSGQVCIKYALTTTLAHSFLSFWLPLRPLALFPTFCKISLDLSPCGIPSFLPSLYHTLWVCFLLPFSKHK